MTLRERPILVSTCGAVGLALLLVVLWMALPLSGSGDHAAGHLSLGIPVVLLLVVAMMWWPAPQGGRAGLLARRVLLAGLAIFGGGLVIESIGAFGFDGDEARNGLAVAHDVGVIMGPLGMVLTMAGATVSAAVAVAVRRGAADSRWVVGAVVLAVVVAVAFAVGGLVFGY